MCLGRHYRERVPHGSERYHSDPGAEGRAGEDASRAPPRVDSRGIAKKARVFFWWQGRQTVWRLEYSRAAPPRAISRMWSTSRSRARRRVPHKRHVYRSRSMT